MLDCLISGLNLSKDTLEHWKSQEKIADSKILDINNEISKKTNVYKTDLLKMS
jgi:hypothetical protein